MPRIRGELRGGEFRYLDLQRAASPGMRAMPLRP